MSENEQPKKLSQQVKDNYFLDASSGVFERIPPFPANMMLELSNACNHKCIFCANPHMQRRRRHMETGFVERILREAVAEGVRQVGFYTTGDPFIHKGLADFVRTAKQVGFEYIYLSTNGALATPEKMRAVIDAGADSIKFSINAGSRETYRLIHGADDWETVLAHLRFAAEYRKTLANPPRLYVTCVPTRQIEHEMADYKALFEPLVDEVFYTPCGNQSGQMSAAQVLLGYADNFNPNAAATICNLPFNRLHVTAEGYLTACCVDYHNYLAVADLNTMSLREAWASPAAQALRARHLEHRLEGTLCGNCWLGRRDRIEPVDAKLAAPIDFQQLYASQESRTLDRLGTVGPKSEG